MMRWMWLALALALGGVQLGCDEPGVGSNEDRDKDGVPDSEDCDDTSRLAWRRIEAFRDEDKDGHGSGALQWFCAGNNQPSGTAATADDCAPQDATRWRQVEGTYYTDADRDGVVSAAPAGTCLGPDVSAYTHTPGTDCDDANPQFWRLLSLYADGDRDGYEGGEPVQLCIGTTIPLGHSGASRDCAPTDPARYQWMTYSYRDADADGATIPANGHVCAGSLLPPGYSNSSGSRVDCDDTRADRWETASLYRDTDGDGIGSGLLEARCATTPMESGYSAYGTDCAPEDRTLWTMRDYYSRDEDKDGFWKATWAQVCSGSALPAGYSTGWASPSDCDDTNATAHTSWTVYPDTDNDGVGAGSSVTLCAGTTRPAGYAATSNDCDPEDNARWQNFTYQYRDADADTYTVASSGALCIGATPPAGYTHAAKGNDCDDARADVYQGLQGYVDEDGDGVGTGTASTFCTAGALPAGQSATGTDCAPTDASSWQSLTFQYVDADGDGRTVPASGQVCTGSTLPAPYATKANGNDCDETNPALFLWRVLYPDKDGDGVGVPPRVVMCLGDGPIPSGYSIYGFDPDDSKPGVAFPPEELELEVLLLDD